MARYIDANALMKEVKRIGGHNLCEWHTIGVKALIERQPTADVVSRAEVEREIGEEIYRIIGEEIYRIIGDGDNETWICLLIRKLADKLIKKNGSKAETCVVCGDVIPEGRQVCPNCAKGGDN